MSNPTRDELIEEFLNVMQDGEPRIQGGDCFPIDNYVFLLRHLGFQAEYENIHSGYGFIAQVRINGARHAIWQGGVTQTDQSVLCVQEPLESFEAESADLRGPI